MKETTENNILLAKFLGATKTDLKGRQKPIWYPILGASHTQLHFHNDWNWLMLVVNRIESIIVDRDNYFNVTIGGSNYCVIQDSNGVLYEGIEEGKESKLLTVYFACIQFVKWFNPQSK